MEPDSRLWANPDLLKLWLWCLAKAAYLDRKWVSIKSGKGFIDIEIKRGQFLYGRHSAASELNINPSTMRERISKLKKLGFIDIKSDKQYSIITICNYDYYQTRDNEKGQPQRQQTHQPTLTPDDTNKKEEKDKKGKKEDIETPENKFSDDSPGVILSKLLFSEMQKNDPKAKEPNFQTWAVSIDRLIRLDKREIPVIREIIIWCQKSEFWKPNIMSTPKLREKFPQLLMQSKEKKGERSSRSPSDWSDQKDGIVKDF